MNLRHLAVDIALIVERSFVLPQRSHLIIVTSLLKNQTEWIRTLKNIGPQRVALLLGDGGLPFGADSSACPSSRLIASDSTRFWVMARALA